MADEAVRDRPRTNREVTEGLARLFEGPPQDDTEGPAAEAPDVTEAEPVEGEPEEVVDGEDPEAGPSEPDDEQEGEPADPEDETTSDEPYWTVPVDGQDVPIATEEEARTLARQGMHYTKRMQELSEQRQQFDNEREAAMTQVRQKEDQYVGALRNLEQMFGHVLGDEPDWTKLYSENPEQYAHTRAQWDNLAQIRSEVERVEAERKEQRDKEFQDYVREQKDQLVAKVPEWTDPKQKQADFEMIREYALSQGYTDEELGQVWNHRDWITLRDAARYRKAQAAGKQGAKQAASKTVEPGKSTGPVNAQTRRYKQQRKRARESGKEKDIAPLMARFVK